MPLKLSPTQIAFNARGDGKFNKPFQEQIDFLKSKLNLPSERYDDIRKSAHDRAFMVAGAAKADLLNDLHDAINKAAEGESIGKFRQRFDEIVRRNGWEGWTGSGSKKGRDWRTRVIYQTNLSTSYAAGRYKQLNDPDLRKVRPYWQYIHNDTVQHPRPLHVSWSGLVLHADDPWWQTHFPPNGWGCRCRVKAVRESEFKGEKAPDDGTYTHIDSGGTRHTVPNGIDYGFDYAPGARTDTKLREFVQEKLIKNTDAIGQALTRDINRHIVATTDIAGFARVALENKNSGADLWLGFVENPEMIKQVIGADLTGYFVTLPAHAVRHVDRSRAFDGGNQRPADPEDFTDVMSIFADGDVSAGKISGKGNLTIKVMGKTKNNEAARIVFEILTGKRNRTVALKSMVIKVDQNKM